VLAASGIDLRCDRICEAALADAERRLQKLAEHSSLHNSKQDNGEVLALGFWLAVLANPAKLYRMKTITIHDAKTNLKQVYYCRRQEKASQFTWAVW